MRKKPPKREMTKKLCPILIFFFDVFIRFGIVHAGLVNIQEKRIAQRVEL